MRLPKAYEAKNYETDIYKKWEQSGAFKADNASSKPHFSIAMPPPNETGTLHVGHALFLTLQDVMARHARQQGKDVLWLPGTDHAAIATNALIEKALAEQGTDKHQIGREEFLNRTKEFVANSRETINSQIRAMGASVDWSRSRNTLDDALNRCVNETFVKMYNDGLIYRGHRIVNWDPNLETTISDDEVEHKEEKGSFYTLQYGPFRISTARPETKFGDKYVVMHPNDERYKQYKDGEQFEAEWLNGKIMATVVKDEAVDPAFGTGVMTITPWHDRTDFEIAERHGLEREQIIDYKGKLLPIAGEFAGMGIDEARPKIVQKLKEKGLLVKVDENYVHNLALNSRGKGVIEPQIMLQWFVDVDRPAMDWKGQKRSLKEVMRAVVEDGDIQIIPKRFEKIYYRWIDNLYDWCISRQIWWGHQVPVWYKGSQSLDITFFAHATTIDNEAGRATGQDNSPISDDGQKQLADLGQKVSAEEFDVIFCSDLRRAVETAEAIADGAKVIQDKRLREINIGDQTGQPDSNVDPQFMEHLNIRFDRGESLQDVQSRIKDFLDEIGQTYGGKKIAIVGHKFTQLALDVLLKNLSWEEALQRDWRNDKNWQPGWQYVMAAAEGQIYVGVQPPEGEGWKQDDDTLDTWFSSALWTWSTLVEPELANDYSLSLNDLLAKSPDFQTYHPTSVMETGWDLLFFWVARMILCTTYMTGQVPFKIVYMHGLVRTEEGKKMSKSDPDTIIDPLDVIPEYGTDALRLALVSGEFAGNDQRLGMNKIVTNRNFANKLWNIARYIEGVVGEQSREGVEPKSPADHWIVRHLTVAADGIAKDLAEFRFAEAYSRLYHFVWDDFADWYVEASKTAPNAPLLAYVLEQTLKIAHPFAPFVTEAIWQELGWNQEMLISQPWPQIIGFEREKGLQFKAITELVTEVRWLSAMSGVKAERLYYKDAPVVAENTETIAKLAGLKEVKAGESGIKLTSVDFDVWLDVDPAGAKDNLQAKLTETEGVVKALEVRLANKAYVENAPAELVEESKTQLVENRQKLDQLQEVLGNLSA